MPAEPAGAGRELAASSTTPPTPRSLRWAIWLLASEAGGLLAVMGLLLYQDLTAPARSARGAVLVTVFAAMMAATLAFLSRSLSRRRRWARGPAIVLQLLMLPIGYSMAAGGLPWLGLPVIAVGLAGAASLLAPATRLALDIR